MYLLALNLEQNTYSLHMFASLKSNPYFFYISVKDSLALVLRGI